MNFLFFGLALVWVGGVIGADKSVTVGNITTKVKGRSGKIAIYMRENEADGVTITFDAIKEIDTNGAEIMGGQDSHSYQNFAQLDFIFSPIENSTYPETNISVTQFSFNANISIDAAKNQVATLTTYIYIFTEKGNITVDGENVSINAGDVKFNVKIDKWPFCGSTGVDCMKGQSTLTGQFLDFYIEMKGKAETSAKGDSNGTYDLGDDITVLVPTQVIYDGMSDNATNMPSGYPQLTTQGGKKIFVFRFDKFNQSALYDPIVSLGGENDNGSNGSEPAVPDGEVGAAGIVAKVKGHSGKIEIKKTSSIGDSPTSSITVEFDNLQEVDVTGKAIQSHGFNTFANQNFAFSAVSDGTYMDTGIGVQKVNFNATLSNNAVLNVHLYAFKAAGNISNGDETIMVQVGTVKFNVEISNWMFCVSSEATCKNDVGEYLDFEIVIKGSSGSAKKGMAKEKRGEKYDLGTSGSVTLSKKVKLGNGNYTDMVADFPKLMTKGSKEIFMFRFNKSTNIMYDPTLTLSELSNGGATLLHAYVVTSVSTVVCHFILKCL